MTAALSPLPPEALDAIEVDARDRGDTPLANTVLRLVAEVRQLRARTVSPRHPLLSEQINGAPEPLRTYVHELETHVDPTGTVQEVVARRENQRALEVLLEESRAEVARLRDRLERVEADYRDAQEQ
jgi:hypothetical protein